MNLSISEKPKGKAHYSTGTRTAYRIPYLLFRYPHALSTNIFIHVYLYTE